MTIPGFIILSSLIGASLAFAARIQIRTLQKSIFSARYFKALMIFQISILLPAGIYFYTFYPDWSWMYLLDTSSVGKAITVMAIVSYLFAGIMGYLVGYYSSKSSSDWITVVFMVFMILGLTGLFSLAHDKILNVGTFQQFHRSVGTKNLTSTSLLPSMILAAAGISVCWSNLVYQFVQEGRSSVRS